jgi:hypothetical protein
MPCGRSNFAASIASNARGCIGGRNEGSKTMRDTVKQAIMAVLGAIALTNGGAGSAAAADIPAAQAQLPPPGYYAPPPPVAQGYAYPPPVAYGYPPPPAYYAYEEPPVVVVPEPRYWERGYRPLYGGRPYGVRGYGPYVARGYGHYERPWGRGYRGW